MGFRHGKASRAGPMLFAIIGCSLIASGPLVLGAHVTDPMAMLGNRTSWHGILHGIFGALVFALAPISCFVFLRSFGEDRFWQASRM
ncbi:MAG: DUF998 domain-containing protein [Acidobacteriota bacterium]